MKKIIIISSCLLLAGSLSSCYVNKFNIGDGAQSDIKVKKWNHYLFGGLIPIGTADPVKMAAGANDYTVIIKHNIPNMFVGMVTLGIYTPTITVVKK